MERLRIPRQIFDAMVSHCRADLPDEACGILAGRGNEVSDIYGMTNREASRVSYLMDSAEQFRALKDMREKKLDMVGIFHSHPSSPAYPSPKDVELAFYEDAVYVIVSLEGREPVVKGFNLKGGVVQEAEIVVWDAG